MTTQRHIVDVVDELARERGGDPALTVGDETLSYAELAALSRKAASLLSALGLGRDEVVALPMHNSHEQAAFFLGAWRLGATPLPLSHAVPDVELEHILAAAGARIVLREGQDLDRQTLRDGPNLVASRCRAQASGGSTGLPKVSVDLEPSTVDPGQDHWGWTLGDTMFVPGPTFHSGPMNHLIGGLTHGVHVVMMRKFDAHKALELMARHRAHWALFVPTMMNRILKLGEEEIARADLSCLKRVWTSAAYCPAWLKQAWMDIVGADRVWEIFGSSEGVTATIISGSEAIDHPGSVGRVMPPGEVAILDAEGKPLPPREVGEIYMRNKVNVRRFVVVSEYERRMSGDWESFGDLGWLDEDGFLYLADRRVDMINSGGQNVYPAEVEAAILRHPRVDEAVVFGQADEDLGEMVCALVYASKGDLDSDQLLAYLSSQITRYKIPRRIAFSDEPIRNDAGKVRRSDLGAIFLDAQEKR